MRQFPRILLYLMLPVILLMLVSGFAYHLYGNSMARKSAQRQLTASAQLTTELIQRDIDTLDRTVQSLLLQEPLRNYHMYQAVALVDEAADSRLEIERTLVRLTEADKNVNAVEFYSPSGDRFVAVVQGKRDLTPKNVQEQVWFQEALSHSSQIGMEPDGQIRVSRVGRDEHKQPIAVATMLYDSQDAIADAADFATRSFERAEVRLRDSFERIRFQFHTLPTDDVVLSASERIGCLGATIEVLQSESAALATFHNSERALFYALSLVTVFLLVIALFGTQIVVRHLQVARQRADAANRAKSTFLTNMSHEIRTPMNGILGMLQLLRNTELSSQQREYASIAKSSADSLLCLINDILDISKIEAGKLELESIAFPLHEVIAETIQPLELQAVQKGLELTLYVQPGVPDEVVGDPTRLRQVLINLVGNAIKFTDQGRVSIRIESEAGTTDTEACLSVEVQDTGIGIPEDKQQSIFAAFNQADASTTRRFGGTGLGLAITAELIEQMGGRLTVRSQPDEGSIFSFTLRLPRPAQPLQTEGELSSSVPTEKSRSAEQPKSGHILLVEDVLINRKVAETMLRMHGHDVTIAKNGHEAIAKVHEMDFDLILMDIEMPEMDGLEATTMLRLLEKETGKHTPIIAMTAHAIKGDRARFLAHGMDDYLAKPVELEELRKLVEKHLGTSSPAPSSPMPAVSRDTNSTESITDLTGTLANVGGDRTVVQELIEAFLGQLVCYREDLERAFKDEDTEKLRRTAHTLKGSVSIFGAKKLADLAASMEAWASQGNLESAKEHRDDLERLLSRVEVELSATLDSKTSVSES